jgi:two-component system alkaline phosphatase synthesis response regulator PhoP
MRCGFMNAPKHILVADADPAWRERIVESLGDLRAAVHAVASGGEALELALREKPSAVVTELVLPELTGLGLTRILREDAAMKDVGIVMVTDHANEIDRVLAFESGVDDLLAKPFFARELASRVQAVLRRSEPERGARPHYAPAPRGLVTLHPSSGSVLVNDERVDLTPREFHLLAALLRHAGRVVTRQQIIAEVWGGEAEPTDRLVDAHVKAIRRKLGPAKQCIETVRGVGYRFSDIYPPALE